MLPISLVLLAIMSVSVRADTYPNDFACPICEDFASRVIYGIEDPQKVCQAMKVCDFILPKMEPLVARKAHGMTPLSACRDIGMCVPEQEPYKKFLPPSSTSISPLNLRVSRGYGTKGYNTLRVSVIDDNTTNRSASFRSFFDYDEAFQYRWSNKHLYSKLVTITPGEATTLQIGEYPVTVRIPKENTGTRGVIIADPCFSSRWVICSYGDQLSVLPRMTSLLNSGFSHEGDLDFWYILGDMFYDRDGSLADQFFSMLTPSVLQSAFATTAGNHDYWVYGSPLLESAPDQFGNGFMQYYTMDTMASTTASNKLFNFGIDPDHPSNPIDPRAKLAAQENFFFLNKIGNVAFMGYSGAYTWEAMKPNFEQGCQWLGNSGASVVFLMGHWNSYDDGLTGAEQDMIVPAVYQEIKNMSGCSGLGSKLKYVMGHTHCNKVMEANTGYMVAGQGMEGCGNFGIPYFDTNDGRLEILYFPIADTTGMDSFEILQSCVAKSGFSGCKSLATVWFNQSLSSLV